jgi:CRISPR-associated protein Cas2
MYIILVYDVEVKRVGKVCKYLRQHLTWVQNSVFEGELTKAQLARVISGLMGIIDEDKDSVLVYKMRALKWMNKEVIGVDKNPATNLL